MADTGKFVEVMFENALETYESQQQMLGLVTATDPDDAAMQSTGNYVWRSVEQHAPIFDGFDMSGNATDIIQETYPALLGTPKNDIIEQRVDDLRDQQFWINRGKTSGRRQASGLNKAITDAIVDTGSMFYQTAATSGYAAISEAQAMYNERQLGKSERHVMLNDRDLLEWSADLAARQTLQGQPADTWRTGQIGSNIAEFDVHTGSSSAVITGGAITATTTTAAVSEAPTAGTVAAATGVVTNVDYRTATIPVTASAAYAVGDYIKFTNTSTDVQSIGLDDKTPTGQPMTFKIISIPNGTSIEIYPKPIAADDAALSDLEKAYANIDTQITSGATLPKINTTASAKANLIWTKDSIEVMRGDAPVDLLAQFGGMKVMSETMSNGQKMYVAYDGDITTLQFTCRIFTWYGITNANPSENGVFTNS